MRFVFSILVVMVLGVIFALYAREDPGYVMINYRQWSIEASLVLTVVFLLITFVAFYYLVRMLSGTRSMPNRLARWHQHRRSNKARKSQTEGMISLARGHWNKAERQLLKNVSYSDSPMLGYLSAARAAQKQGANSRRDKYLKLAHQSSPNAQGAVALTRAELQISNGQLEQALATLNNVRHTDPKNTTVLKLLIRLYTELQDWQRLLDIIPQLRKLNAIKASEAKRLETLGHAELLKNASRTNNAQTLVSAWSRIPRDINQDRTLILDYATYLMNCNAGKFAEELVYNTLNKSWNDSLGYIYGLIKGADDAIQFGRSEVLVNKYGDNAIALLTAGRLAIRNELWGKARKYLEASIEIDPQPETYQEYARLLDHMGEKETALEYYRKGTNSFGTKLLAPNADKHVLPGVTVSQPRLLPTQNSA
ncbi:MAG: heme biosynthesis protein HemY [Gammaproteobacteria bacterium]